MREFERDEGAYRFGENDFERDDEREFEIAVECKQDKKNQNNGKRADDIKLRLCLYEFAIFAAPIEAITFGKLNIFRDGSLACVDGSFEVAAGHGKLHADITGI